MDKDKYFMVLLIYGILKKKVKLTETVVVVRHLRVKG